MGDRERWPDRADDQRVVLVIEDLGQRGLRVDLLDVVLGEGHRRGLDHLGREQWLEQYGTASVDEAGTGPSRGTADEQRGARVVERTGDHQQLAEAALVAALFALGSSRAIASSSSRDEPSGTANTPGPTCRIRPPSQTRPVVVPSRPDPVIVDLGGQHPRGIVECLHPLEHVEQLALPIVQPLVDVEREHVAPTAVPDPERDRHRVVRLVGDRDRDPAHPELVGALRRPPMEADRRLAGRQAFDLDAFQRPRARPSQDLDTASFAAHPAPRRTSRGQPGMARRSFFQSKRFAKRAPKRSMDARIRSTLMMSMPALIIPSGTMPAGRTGSGSGPGRPYPYSTVTDLARLRGLVAFRCPRATAV